jgi:heptosyltransferase I
MLKTPLDRICIVMMSAVGDAVHVLPVINALKRHSPRSRISWIMQPGPATLVRGHPSVDEIILFDRSKGWRAFTDVRRALAGKQFDVALALQVYFKAGVVTSFVNASVKLGFDRARARDMNWLFTTHRIPPHPVQHVQDQYFEFLTELGVPHEPVEWGLGPWRDERAAQREFFARLDRPAASIVVATSKPEKDWPPERWAEVCDALYHDFGLQPVLVGGRSPRELNAERVIIQRARARPVSALGSGLRPLVGIIDGSALVLAPDTGPLHMTVALDRPVISLMGYTNPKRTGPYRRFHDLIIDAYGEPGEDYPISMENRPGRMPRIQVRDVIDRVELWRTRYASAAGRTASASTSGPKG